MLLLVTNFVNLHVKKNKKKQYLFLETLWKIEVKS